MKYVLKEEIEAVQFTGNNFDELVEFVGKREAKDCPGFFINNFAAVWEYNPDYEEDIKALVYHMEWESWLPVREGDYIVKGDDGCFYPSNKERFEERWHPKQQVDVRVNGVITAEQINRQIGMAIQQSRRFQG